MFVKAFLEIAKTWKQLTLLSAVEGMSKDEQSHTHTLREREGGRRVRRDSIQVEKKKIMIFVIDDSNGHDIK